MSKDSSGETDYYTFEAAGCQNWHAGREWIAFLFQFLSIGNSFINARK